MNTIQVLTGYLLRILPGLGLIALVLILIKPNKYIRAIIYIFTFILMRDAMTPLGLWSLGKENGIVWLRMSKDPLFLLIFGLCSLLMVIGLYVFDRENSRYLIWFKSNRLKGIFYGLAGCIGVVLPFVFLYKYIDISKRGGAVNTSLILPLLIFALLGNLLEETLFRGYLLGYLQKNQNSTIAGINSGVLFSFCHIFLALTVTDIGLPILIFTLWEGVIAGLVGAKYGIIPATITHGGAIFILSSGLF